MFVIFAIIFGIISLLPIFAIIVLLLLFCYSIFVINIFL